MKKHWDAVLCSWAQRSIRRTETRTGRDAGEANLEAVPVLLRLPADTAGPRQRPATGAFDVIQHHMTGTLLHGNNTDVSIRP